MPHDITNQRYADALTFCWLPSTQFYSVSHPQLGSRPMCLDRQNFHLNPQ